MSRLRPLQEWWARRSKRVQVTLGIVGALVVLSAIGNLTSKSDDERSTTTASVEQTTSPTATRSGTHAHVSSPVEPRFQCSAKDFPSVCDIGRHSLDIPLMAVATPGVPEGGLGIDYSLGLGPHAHANQVTAAAALAQMAIAYKATVKAMDGRDVGFIDAAAYAYGDKAEEDSPVLATSIGRGQIQRIAAGADPIDVWRVDAVSPLFRQAGVQP